MAWNFYYDIVCPYAYMAFSILHRAGAFNDRVSLRPILLGGLFKEMGVASDPNQKLSTARRDYLRSDIARQAELFDVKLVRHPRHPVSTVNAMRLLHACDELQRLALTERLYQGYWQDHLDIDDEEVLSGLKKEFAINDVRFNLAKDELRKATSEAFKKKIFGVPTLQNNDRLYFGADRLELIADELGISLPDSTWHESLPIDFYFDFSSPYSYLAWAEVKRAMSKKAHFNIKPVLLGAIFKEIGTADVPMLSAHPHKAAYYLKDMHDWAKHRSINFAFNSRFPLRTVLPLRVALADEQVIDPIFKAAWSDNQDIGDEAVLGEVLRKAGFDHQKLLERAQEESIKGALKRNTSLAVARGVFGVPTFFVDNQMIFGQDRFLWIRKAKR